MTPYILAFQAFVWLLISGLFIQSRNASIFHPFSFYLAFHGLVFVVRPIMEYAFGFEQVFFYMQFYPSEDQLEQALFLTTAALVVFAIASHALDAAPRLWPISDGFNARQWRAFIATAIILGPIVVYSTWLAIQDSVNTESGNALVQADRDVSTGIMTFSNTTGYLVDAGKTAGVLCLMLIWGTRFRLWSFIPLALYVLERMYEGWARWTIVLPLISLAMLYSARRGKRWLPVGVIAVAIPLFVIFQQLGENREAFKALLLGQTIEETAKDDRSWIERQDNLDFANFDYLTYVMSVVPEKSQTYTYFTQYLQLFTEPIPRVLWPSKPIGPPIQLVNLNDYGDFVGLTVSIVGDGWLSAGWLGTIITILTVAGTVSAAHRWLWRSEMSTFKILIYCTFLPLTLQWYRDGGISIAKFVLFSLAPIVLWHALARYFGAAPARSQIRQPRTAAQPAALPPGE